MALFNYVQTIRLLKRGFMSMKDLKGSKSFALISARRLKSVPFPEGLCVWRADLLRSSPPHPEFACGAPQGKRWTQTWPGRERERGDGVLTTPHVEWNSSAGDWDSRLVVNWVEVFLEGVSFPPAWPPFVREQVEADVRIWAVVGERDQVSVEKKQTDVRSEQKNTDFKEL